MQVVDSVYAVIALATTVLGRFTEISFVYISCVNAYIYRRRCVNNCVPSIRGGAYFEAKSVVH